MEKTGILVTGVVAGTLIGTTIALLVAPNPGKNTRQAIRGKITLFRRPYSKKCYQSVVALLQGATPKAATSALSGTSGLSRREKEVLQKLVEGLRNRDVARSLHISVSTVQSHLAHIYHNLNVLKVDVPRRTAAVACAVHDGLVALKLVCTLTGAFPLVGLRSPGTAGDSYRQR